MQSNVKSPAEYLASLPADRRALVAAVRKVILDNLDAGYAEGMQYGMLAYFVPHSVYPKGYHVDPRQPLGFAALGSQKQGISLYLMSLYGGDGGGPAQAHLDWFRAAWQKTGKKLDDLPLDLIGEAIRRVPAKVYIERYEAALAEYARKKAAGKGGPAKARTAAMKAPARGAAAARGKRSKG